MALAEGRERREHVLVSHLSELARRFEEKDPKNFPFPRAERNAGGGRTFKVVEGRPLRSSFGAGLYEKILEAQRRGLN